VVKRALALKEEAQNILDEYVGINVLKKSDVYPLWRAKNYVDIITDLKSFMHIDSEVRKCIWDDIINNVSVGVLTPEDKQSMLTPEETVLFRAVINNKGALSRSDALKNHFKSRYQLETAVEGVTQMNLIDCYALSNNDVIYVLNLKYFKEVMKKNGKAD